MKDKIRRIILKALEHLGGNFHHSNRNDRVGMLHRAWGYAVTNFIRGAYYEFGVYQGESFIASWVEYLKWLKWVRRQLSSSEEWRREAIMDYASYKHEFYGFDTFDGMPENDEGGVAYLRKGCFMSSYDDVNRRCLKAGVKCKLFKGPFSKLGDETLNSMQDAAIVNIDSDLYISARDALEKVKGKLQQGTVLLMDDYHCFSSVESKGEKRALREFCEKYPQFRFEPWVTYLYVGQSFICHIADNNLLSGHKLAGRERQLL